MLKMEIIKELGQIVNPETDVLWVVPHFYDLLQENNTVIRSPRFHHEGREFYMEFYPNGRISHSSLGWFGIGLMNLNSDSRFHSVTLAISSRTDTKGNVIGVNGDYQGDGFYCCLRLLPTSILKYCKRLFEPEGNLCLTFSTNDEDEDENDENPTLLIHLLANDAVKCLTENFKDVCTETSAEAEEKDGLEKLTQDFKELLRSGNTSDFVLRADNQEFKAHKCVLAARSPVFLAMMMHDTKEKISSNVDIPDIVPKIVEEFINYLYTGRVENLTSDNVVSLYKAADKYQVNDLKKRCLNYMMKNVSIENFCDILTLSLLHDEKDLKEICIQFFLQNSLDIVLTSKWQTFLDENPVVGNELFIKHLRSIKDADKKVMKP